MIRLALSLSLVLCLPSCGLFNAMFGDGMGASQRTTYQSAMADFSLCETAPDPSERSAAATRLAQAAQGMAAETQSANPDHVQEMDRVVAANVRCQSVMAAR